MTRYIGCMVSTNPYRPTIYTTPKNKGAKLFMVHGQKRYEHISHASQKRIANLVNHMVAKGKGEIIVSDTPIGWFYHPE